MSLELYGRVLWRFRALIAGGFVLAVLLAMLSLVKVDFKNGPGLAYRSPQTWQSTATVLITQPGFPWGRVVLPGTGAPIPAGTTGATTTGSGADRKVPFADPARFASLSLLYAQMANSDAVQRAVRLDQIRRGGTPGKVTATAVQEIGIGPLPLISFVGTADSAAGAKDTTAAAVRAFTRFIGDSQTRAGIAVQDRIELQQLQQPSKPIVALGRKKTLPVMIFLTVMIAVCGLAFLLENARPQPRKGMALAAPPVVDAGRELPRAQPSAGAWPGRSA